MIQGIIQPIREMLQAYATTFRFLTTFKPVYHVPLHPAPRQLEKPIDRQLSVTNNQLGFFVIGGKQLKILHPDSSRCGRILARLVKQRSHLVSYDELQEVIGAGDVRKDLKDLRRQLKKEGYKFEYKLVRTKGIALIGLSLLQ